MGPQTYNPSPNMPSRPNNGYGAPQTANYYNPYYVNPNFNQQVPIQPRPCPVPAYNVPNPYCNCGHNNYNYNNCGGCGC